jgi:hypothetical protein
MILSMGVLHGVVHQNQKKAMQGVQIAFNDQL